MNGVRGGGQGGGACPLSLASADEVHESFLLHCLKFVVSSLETLVTRVLAKKEHKNHPHSVQTLLTSVVL